MQKLAFAARTMRGLMNKKSRTARKKERKKRRKG
jgi:hypothetical protein